MPEFTVSKIIDDLNCVKKAAEDNPKEILMTAPWLYVEWLLREIEPAHRAATLQMKEISRLTQQLTLALHKESQHNAEYAALAKAHLKLQRKCEGLLREIAKKEKLLVANNAIMTDTLKVWQVNTNTTKETEMSLNNKEKAIVLAVRGIPAPFTAAEAAAAYNEANGGTDYTADSIAGPLSNIVKDGFANPAQFSLTELGQTADLG